MKTLEDIKKSANCPLMLGTVQFGLDYGIANTSGKPSYDITCNIVKCAYEGGIDCMDTAAAYGDSEKILGRILDDLDIRNEMLVVTKVAPLPKDISTAEIEKWIEDNLNNSCKCLKTDTLAGVLLHSEKDFEKAFEYMLRAKERGQILSAGISGGASAEITMRAVESASMDALQIPSNMFDRRFRKKDGVMEKAAQQNMAVFIRSAYLQGLAVMPIDKIKEKPHFKELVPIRERIEEIAKQSGITLCELAMRYVLSLDGITRLVVGVDTVQQMQENIAIASAGPLPDDILQAIDDSIPELPDDIVNPAVWK